MVVIENSIFQELKEKQSIPKSTLLLDVKTCPLGKANVIKIALMLTRANDKWVLPLYMPIIGTVRNEKLQWAICPWIDDAILNQLATLVPPSVLLTRLSPEDETVLLSKLNELWPEKPAAA